MHDTHEALLDLIQSGFPLEHAPYETLGKRVGLDEAAAFAAIQDMQKDGLIRRLGASFSSCHVGYASTLCAFAVEEDRKDEVAALVSASPYVTHNYAREHEFNIWFTVMGHGKDERDAIFEDLKTRAGVERALNLPALALYKIRVDFSEMKKAAGKIAHNTAEKQAFEKSKSRPFDEHDPFDIALIRFIQADILQSGLHPFEAATAYIQDTFSKQGVERVISEKDVLARIHEWKQDGTIRRFGAMVRHRKMGYLFNGMSVWDIPEDKRDAAGNILKEFPQVSHCYARPRSDVWPYNVYGMAHAQSEAQLREVIERMHETLEEELACDITYDVLISTQEYKKTSMTYFPQE